MCKRPAGAVRSSQKVDGQRVWAAEALVDQAIAAAAQAQAAPGDESEGADADADARGDAETEMRVLHSARRTVRARATRRAMCASRASESLRQEVCEEREVERARAELDGAQTAAEVAAVLRALRFEWRPRTHTIDASGTADATVAEMVVDRVAGLSRPESLHVWARVGRLILRDSPRVIDMFRGGGA